MSQPREIDVVLVIGGDSTNTSLMLAQIIIIIIIIMLGKCCTGSEKERVPLLGIADLSVVVVW